MAGSVFSFFLPRPADPLRGSSLSHSVINPNAVIAIRWLALAGQSAALIFVAAGLGFDGAFASAFGLVFIGALMNIWQGVRARYRTLTSRAELVLALSFDVLQLAGLLYLTGGLANPFAMLFLAPIVVSAALLDFRSTVFLVLLVGLCAVVLTHLYLPLPFSEAGFALPALYLSGILSALVVSCVFIGFYVWFLADRARQTTAELAAMQLLLERDRQATTLGTLAAAAAHKLGSPLNTIAVISHDMAPALKGKIGTGDQIYQDVVLLQQEVERCRVILSELDRDAQADRLGSQVALPFSQMITGLLDSKMASLGARIELSSGPRDASKEPLSKPLPDLKYALETLLDNASDYARSTIRLDIGWTQTHVEVAVCDDGPGFSQKVLARHGQPWNSSREGQSGHKGLGLFLAMTLIEALDGEMQTKNHSEGGAVVSLTIPRDRLL